MEKVDAQLLTLLEQRERELTGVARSDAAGADLANAPIEVRVEFEGDSERLRTAGFPLFGMVLGVARGGLSPAQIRDLIKLPYVLSVGRPHRASLLLDVSVPEIKANNAWAIGTAVSDLVRGKGGGVVVGIVDSGIDVFHGAFRKDGKTRIWRLWDQTFRFNGQAPADDSGPLTGDLVPKDETGAVLTPARAPAHFGAALNYGAEFTNDHIDAALAAHPDGKNLPRSLTDQPVTMPGGHVVHHGSHVAGIAAGNGAQNDKCTNPFTYVGVAPEAELVIVKTGVGQPPGAIQNLSDAVQYIFAAAALPVQNHPSGRPCVVNISMGGHNTPHNGWHDEGRAFELLTAGPLSAGRVIVIAAGNDRIYDLHAAFMVPRTQTQTVRINLTGTVKKFFLFASFNPAANLTCAVRLPPNGGAAVATQPRSVKAVNGMQPLGTHNVQVLQLASAAGDPDGHFRVQIFGQNGADVMRGVWEFDLVADAAADANVHLWVASPLYASAVIQPFVNAVASAQDANRDATKVKRPADWIGATVGDVGTWPRAITVAAYSAQESGTPLAIFSSQGPAPNNLALGLYAPAGAIPKPDIAAPGVAIDAPRGQARKCCLECECCVDRYVAEQGTSQAAPHITGVVALMLAQRPGLTSEEIKTLLQGAARTPPALPPGWPPPAELWGAGKVDAETTMGDVINLPRVETGAEAAQPQHVPDRVAAPVGWPERIRRWNEALSPRPAFNLCAALVSLHFDEVKRLIDTNRRIGAVWQRHGGPALVRSIVFADEPPDPPVPAALATGQMRELMLRLLTLLARYGGEALRNDIARYSSLMHALPGASWDQLDALVENGGPP